MLPTNGKSKGSDFFVDGSVSFLTLTVDPVSERLNFCRCCSGAHPDNNRIVVEGWMEVEGQGGSGQLCNNDDNEAGCGKDNGYYQCSMICFAW